MPVVKHFVLSFVREKNSHHEDLFVKAIYKPETSQALIQVTRVHHTLGNALFHPNVYTRNGGESTEFSDPINFSPGVKERFENALELLDLPKAIVILNSEAEVNEHDKGTLLEMIKIFNEYLSKRPDSGASIRFTEATDEVELREYTLKP